MEKSRDINSLQIQRLVDTPESIPALADMYEAEWGPYYGHGGAGDALVDLQACANKDQLPMALVAKSDDGAVVGTGALKRHSLGAAEGEEPWLSALVVRPGHRRQGIGTAIMNALIEEAERLGFASVYISTDVTDYLLKYGRWQYLRDTNSLRGDVGIFRCDLA